MKNQLLTLLLLVFSVTQSFSQSDFTIEKDSTDTVYSYHFTPIVTLGDSFYWTFGDGDSSFTSPAFHTYDTLGNYEVCLTDLDTADTTVFCDSVIIECLPVSANITEVHSGTFYLFESNALNASAYLWDFGDGTAADSTANPTHQFPWFGSNDTAFPCPWIVHLTAYNFCDTIEDFMTIVPEPCGSWNIREVTSSSEILISPNPSSDIILLTAQQEFSLRSIRMINGQESIVDVCTHAGSQQEINVSALPSGVYLLEYEIDELIKTQRFAVLH